MRNSASQCSVSLWLLKRTAGDTLVVVSDPTLPSTKAVRLLLDWVDNDRRPKSSKVRDLVLTPHEDLFLSSVSQLENSAYRDSVGELLWEYSSATSSRTRHDDDLMLAELEELEETLFVRGLVGVGELARHLSNPQHSFWSQSGIVERV